MRQVDKYFQGTGKDADLDLGTDEVAVEELPVLNEIELADVLTRHGVVHLAALFASLLLEGPTVFLSLHEIMIFYCILFKYMNKS